MEIYKSYKFRLYPTPKQQDYFNRCIGCGRFVYNWALSLRIDAYKKDGKTLSIRKDIEKLIPKIKEEYDFLKEADSMGLLSELNNLDDAYNRFFKGFGFPKFKKKESLGTMTTRLQKNSIDTKHNRIKTPKIGRVKCVFHRNIEGFVKEKPYITISRTPSYEWYVSIQSIVEIPDEPNINANIYNTIGIDMGLKDFAILDDGTKFAKIENDARIDKRKKRLQHRLAKKVGAKKGQKKSNNYIKLQRKIAKLDNKEERRREQYHYEVASNIVSKDCIFIAMEDLNVKGLSSSGKGKQKLSHEEYLELSKTEKRKYNRKKNKGINRSILNASFFLFKKRLVFKARQNGKKVIEVGRFYSSSQTCSNCGAKNKLVKNLNVREWVCPECGSIHDRDVNAARNIKKEGIRINNNGEITPKNLRRHTPKVKSVEIINNEKTDKVGVNSIIYETETQNNTAYKNAEMQMSATETEVDYNS